MKFSKAATMKLSLAMSAGLFLSTAQAEMQDACPDYMDKGGRRKLHENGFSHVEEPSFLRKLQTSAIINNGVIQLGVNDEGQLNVGSIGLQFNGPSGWVESTEWGCQCEGMGVSAKRMSDGSEFSGYANQASGTGGWVSSDPVVSDGLSASTSAITGGGDLKITHSFAPAPETANLYKVVVELENLSTTETLTELRYKRLMDWDIPPTTFSECVTVGTGTSMSVEHANDDGFQNNNPLVGWGGGINFNCVPAIGCLYEDNGPADHGAGFQFLFKDEDTGALTELPPGGKFSFEIYYGAAANKEMAAAALGAVGAEVYSFGYPHVVLGDGSRSCDHGGEPNTFIFGFSGVGGESVFEGGGDGDPHFKKWNGEWYDFHGICDQVLTSSPSFGNGVGLDIHVRTKPRFEYSFIEATAIKIGEDILQIGSFGEYWLNGVEGVELPAKMGGNYVVDKILDNKKHHNFIINEEGQTKNGISVNVFKDMVNVNVKNATSTGFDGSSGLLGSFPAGVMLGRDGVTVLETNTLFGQEWQVSETDPKLFMTESNPNQPVAGVCVPPVAAEGRRLGEVDVTLEAAEKACAFHTNQAAKDRCIFDVMAMGDLEVAAGGSF